MTTIRLRDGSAPQWATANPVLEGGEVGFEYPDQFKIGDGSRKWSELSYFMPISKLDERYAPIDATSTDATETVKGVLQLAGDLGGTADIPRLRSNVVTLSNLSAEVRATVESVANKADLDPVTNKILASQLPTTAASRSILREVFGQDGDAQPNSVGQMSISNFARKVLSIWKVSNDNVISEGKEPTVRLVYKDTNNVEQMINYDMTIPAGQREAIVTIPSNLLPTVAATKDFGARATVAPASSTGTEDYAAITIGTGDDTGDVPANELTLPVPDGKIGKIAVVLVASSTGAAQMPAVTGGNPPWTTRKLMTDTTIPSSLCLHVAYKPILAGETSYKVTFGGLYASVGVVIVLDTYDQLAMFDPDYVVDHSNSTANPVPFQKASGTIVGDSTTADKERILNVVATRTSAAEFPQNLVNSLAGVTKVFERSTARAASANIHLTIFSRLQEVAGAVPSPTASSASAGDLTSPFNSRWLYTGQALRPTLGGVSVGAFNLTVHGETEIVFA